MPLDLLVPPRTTTRVLVQIPRPISEGGLQHPKTQTKLGFVYWGGTGKIVGTVKKKATPTNTPLRRKVFLLSETLGNLTIAMTWSDATTGAYVFPSLDVLQKYSVYSQDYLHADRAVMSDNLTPEPM